MTESGTIRPVETEADIATVVDLGRRIWTEHYTPILAEGQVPYMLAHFHSEAIIREEIATKGYAYHLLGNGAEDVGYVGFQRRDDVIYLSKLYVLTSARGLGLGRLALRFVRDHARAAGCRAVTLGVNKGNAGTIAAYERIGFRITGEMVTDIGGGYVMDDYAMEWAL